MANENINYDPYNLRQRLSTQAKVSPYNAGDYQVGQQNIGIVDQSRLGGIDDQQTRLAIALRDRAEGRTKSAAELQTGRALDRANSQAMSMASSARGISSGLAARLASQNKLDTQSAALESGAILRAQEQAGAEQQLASALANQRGQTLDQMQMQQERNLAQAQINAQIDATNAANRFGADAGNVGNALSYDQLALSADNAANDRTVQMEGLKYQAAQAQAAADAQKKSSIIGALGSVIGTGAGAFFGGPAGAAIGGKLGSVAGNYIGGLDAGGNTSGNLDLYRGYGTISDERAKKDIEDVPKKSLAAFLSSLKGKSYNYKDQQDDFAPGEKHVGVMAQALEKSEIGRSAVSDEGGKKKISLGRALQLLLAGEGYLHSEIQSLKRSRSAA